MLGSPRVSASGIHGAFGPGREARLPDAGSSRPKQLVYTQLAMGHGHGQLDTACVHA